MIELIFNGLTYNSLAFLVFLFCFLALFFLLPGKWTKIGIIVAGNVFFYIHAAGVEQLIIVALSCVIVYVFSRIIESIYKEGTVLKIAELQAKDEIEYWKPYKKRSKKWLIISIVLLLSTLLYTKAGRLFDWDSVNSLSEFRFGKIIVPLGLSYYTFSSVGYLIDIYKRKVSCEHNPIVLFATITFFPIIVEGPISKIDSLTIQFRNIPQFDYKRFCFGFQRILWGVFKKMVIADRIMPVTSSVFSNIYDFAGIEIVISLLLSSFAFYTDFSGCMDIVIGVAEAMGIVLDENFKQPFFSQDISSFWRRWHISLFSWFRDYIYLSITKTSFLRKINRNLRRRLNNNLGQAVSSAIPTFVVWMIAGLWHGTGIGYLAWALYWFILTMVGMVTKPFFERVCIKMKFRTETFGWKLFRIIRTDVLYILGGTLTLTDSDYGLKGCLYILRQLFAESRIWVLYNGEIFKHGMDKTSFTMVIISICVLMIVESKQNAGYKMREVISVQPVLFRWFIWLLMITIVLTWGQYGPGYSASEFVYKGF